MIHAPLMVFLKLSRQEVYLNKFFGSYRFTLVQTKAFVGLYLIVKFSGLILIVYLALVKSGISKGKH